MISKEWYEEVKARYERHQKWLGNRRSYKEEEVPADCKISNEETTQIEVYEFMNQPPDKYFLYVKEPPIGNIGVATTWMGESLGACHFGREWRDSFGGRRRSVTIYGINGLKYYGTYYKSTGGFARIRRYKLPKKMKPTMSPGEKYFEGKQPYPDAE